MGKRPGGDVPEEAAVHEVVGPSVQLDPLLAYEDLRGLAEQEREAEVLDRVQAEAWRPFDLSRGPLVRAMLSESLRARLAPPESPSTWQPGV